jgi:hypothetical protein
LRNGCVKNVVRADEEDSSVSELRDIGGRRERNGPRVVFMGKGRAY